MSAPAKVTVETFVGLVKQSGLIDVELLKKTWKELKEAGVPLGEPQQVADEFVERRMLTRWQADKLLIGKHKGFFLGKYRLLSHLGTGGMSAVYLAEHVLMRRRVAIKVLPRDKNLDSSYLERFHREAQAVAALDHRNIVRAYDVDQDGPNHFLVMEYVPGQSLHELVVKNGPLDYVPAAEYMRQAAEGLHHAHRMGMVHRDIKPGNLLLDEKGIIKLLDLGLARFFDEKDESSLTVKHDEKVLGTADYLSPEQALNSHTVDVRSDLYSLGCTLYFLLTGHPPFPDGTMAQRLLAHQSKPPRPIIEERADAPPGLVAILEKMMAKKPDERFQTAKDTAAALVDWLNESGGSVWTRMNPSVLGSSQIIGSQSQGSTANVLAGDLSRSAAARADGPLVNTGGAAAASTVGPDHADSGNFLLNQFADTANASPAMETAADPELAALFSEIASEATTTISRSAGARQRAPESPAAPPAAADSPGMEPTIALPDFGAVREEFEPPAPTEFAFPATEQLSFEPQPPGGPPEFAQTLVVSDSPPSLPPTILAMDVPVAPPVATRVAIPVASPAPPVARPVGATPAAAPAARRSTKQPPKRLIIFGGAGVLVMALVLGAFFAFGRGKSSADKDADGKQSTKSSNKNQKKKTGSGEKIAELRGEFTVGPTGKYPTIAAVLKELKTYKNNKSRSAVQIVKVAAGQTFAERIVIDDSFPRAIQFVAEPGPPPVLAPAGPDPIVSVRSKGKVDNFHLEGFRLDATGKDVAVVLSEWTPGAHLKRLEITGFTKTGVHFNGAQSYGKEEDRIVLEAATLRTATPASVGVLISRKTEDSSYIRINQCRFFGPLECGVMLEASARGIEISESIFADAVAGVKFVGEDRAWNDLLIGANTFFQNDRAVVFTNMPASRSADLQFHNNLFVNSKTADVVVEKDYKPADFFLMYRSFPGGSGHNWTTRPESDPPKPDEIATLFETQDGRRGVQDLKFQSTDTAAPEFLAPAPAAPQLNRGTMLDAKRFGPQIGAVRQR